MPVEGDIALEYSRAPGARVDCMDEPSFRALSGLTRGAFFAPAGGVAHHVARIAVDRAPDNRAYRAVVTVLDEADRRISQSTVEGYPCANLLAQVIIGLHLGVSPRPERAPAACPECPAPPPRRRLSPGELLAQVCDELKDVYGPCMDWHAAVMAGGLFAAGYPTDVAGGFYAGGELRFGTYHQEVASLGLELRGLMPARVYTYPTGGYLEVSSFTAALVPCVRWRMLGGCLPLEGGMLIKGGLDISSSRGGINPVLTVGPRLALDLIVKDHFAVRAFVDLRFPIIRPISFNAAEDKDVWAWPIASGLFGLALGFE
jgi:hypothetical protein